MWLKILLKFWEFIEYIITSVADTSWSGWRAHNPSLFVAIKDQRISYREIYGMLFE